jgi:hypothetical protein
MASGLVCLPAVALKGLSGRASVSSLLWYREMFGSKAEQVS